MGISDADKEILAKKKYIYIIISCCYRPPSGEINSFKSFLITDIIKKNYNRKENKLHNW